MPAPCVSLCVRMSSPASLLFIRASTCLFSMCFQKYIRAKEIVKCKQERIWILCSLHLFWFSICNSRNQHLGNRVNSIEKPPDVIQPHLLCPSQAGPKDNKQLNISKDKNSWNNLIGIYHTIINWWSECGMAHVLMIQMALMWRNSL